MVSSWESRQTFSTVRRELIHEQYKAVIFGAVPLLSNAGLEQELRGILPANAKLYGKSIVSYEGPDRQDKVAMGVAVIQLPDESDWAAVREKLENGIWGESSLKVSQLEPLEWDPPPTIENWLHSMQQFIDVLGASADEVRADCSTIGSPLQLSCLDPGARPPLV